MGEAGRRSGNGSGVVMARKRGSRVGMRARVVEGWADGEFARCEMHGWSHAGEEAGGNLNFCHIEFAGIMV